MSTLSNRMKKTSQSILFVSLALSNTMLHAAPLELNCPSFDTEKEQMRIRKLASGVVVRKGAHLLKVSTRTGVQSFKDEPPYDEPFDGVHHSFCDRKEGFILVNVNDGLLFSGKLINEQTGAVTEGGESVLFSEDRRAYLASEQPDGMDGSVWKVYAVNGKLSWSGYNFMPDKDPNYRYADLDTPSWMPHGELVANATCSLDQNRKWKVKLVKNKDEWDWAPRKKCPTSK